VVTGAVRCSLVVGGPEAEDVASMLVGSVPGSHAVAWEDLTGARPPDSRWLFVIAQAGRPVPTTLAPILNDPTIDLDAVITTVKAPAWSTRLGSGGTATRTELSWLAVADCIVLASAPDVHEAALARLASLARAVNRIGPVLMPGVRPAHPRQMVGLDAWRGPLRIGPGPLPVVGAPCARHLGTALAPLTPLMTGAGAAAGLLRVQGYACDTDGAVHEVVGTYGAVRARPARQHPASGRQAGIGVVTDGAHAALAA
jgi:hypothetical protein